jgi:hypothetical protein
MWLMFSVACIKVNELERSCIEIGDRHCVALRSLAWKLVSMSAATTGLTTLSRLTHLFLLILIICLVGVSGVFLLSQAVRTAEDRVWTRNGNAFVIGAAYAAVVRSCPEMKPC